MWPLSGTYASHLHVRAGQKVSVVPPQVPDARCGRLAPMQAEIATPRRATEPEELLEVASRVVEDARPGE